MKFKRQFSYDSDLNLTPLVDLLFVIVMTLIVLAPLLTMDQIQLATSLQAAASLKNSTLCIKVDKENQLFINDQKIAWNDFSTLVAQYDTKSTIPCLFQDKNSSFGSYQTIKNMCELAGFTQLQVVLQPS